MEARWISLVFSLYLDASAGTGYAFGVYSNQLKAALDFSQNDIDLVAFLGNLGTYTCVVGGIIFDRYGVKAAGLFGVLLSLLGYLLLWAGASKHISHTPFLIGVYQFIWCYGSSAVDITVVAVTIRNFPMNCGSLVGLLKSFYGICGALVTRFYASWYQPNAIQFLLFLAGFVSILGGVTLVPVQVVPQRKTFPMSRLGLRRQKFGFAVVVLLCVYLGFVGIMTAEKVFKDGPLYTYIMMPLVALPLIMMLPLKLWTDEEPKPGQEFEPLLNDYNATTIPSVNNNVTLVREDESNGSLEFSSPARPDAVRVYGDTLWGAICTVDFWFLFIIGTSWTGSGLMFINNISQIVQSLGGAENTQDVYVTIISVANCLGRLLAGFGSDFLAEKMSRPMFFVIFLSMLLLGLLVLTAANLSILYPACLLIASAYGSFWALAPTVVKERFGTRALGSISSMISLSAALGSYVLAKTLFADVYQSHTEHNSTVCIGRKCFEWTCVVCAILCGVSLVVSLLLWLRLRGLYLKQDAKAAAVETVYKAPNKTSSGAELAI